MNLGKNTTKFSIKIITAIFLVVFVFGAVVASFTLQKGRVFGEDLETAIFDSVFPTQTDNYIDLQKPSVTATYERPALSDTIPAISKMAVYTNDLIEVRTTSTSNGSDIKRIRNVINSSDPTENGMSIGNISFLSHDFLLVNLKKLGSSKTKIYHISGETELNLAAILQGADLTLASGFSLSVGREVVAYSEQYNADTNKFLGKGYFLTNDRFYEFSYEFTSGVNPLLFKTVKELKDINGGNFLANNSSNIQCFGSKLYFQILDEQNYLMSYDEINKFSTIPLAKNVGYTLKESSNSDTIVGFVQDNFVSFAVGKKHIYFTMPKKEVVFYEMTGGNFTPLPTDRKLNENKDSLAEWAQNYYKADEETSSQFSIGELSQIRIGASKTLTTNEDIFLCDNGKDGKGKKILVVRNKLDGKKPTATKVISSNGNGTDKLDNPKNITISKNEKYAYVADTNNGRVNKYEITATGSLKFLLAIGKEQNLKTPTLVECDTKNGGFYVYDKAVQEVLYYADNDDKGGFKYRKNYAIGGEIVDMEFSALGELMLLEKNNATGINKIYFIKLSEANQINHYKEVLISSNTPLKFESGFTGKTIHIMYETVAASNYSYYIDVIELSQLIAKPYDSAEKIKVSLKDGVIASDFLVDYKGTIVVVDTKNRIFSQSTQTEATLIRYAMTGHSTYGLPVEFKMKDNNLGAAFYDISSIELGENGGIYIANSAKHIIQKYESNNNNVLDITTLTANFFKHPTPDKYLQNTFVAKLGRDTKIQIAPNNFSESLSIKAAGTNKGEGYFYVLAEIIYPSVEGTNYYYGVDASGFSGYIKKEDGIIKEKLTGSPNTDMGGEAVAMLDKVTIYSYPFLTTVTWMSDNRVGVVETDTVFKILNNVGADGEYVWQNEEIKWYGVSYKVKQEDGSETEKLGYVLKSDIIPNTSLTPPKTSRTLKIKADKVGEKVAMYALADIASYVYYLIPDGSEVRLVGKFDKAEMFTKVVYQGKTGYILTQNLTDKGLTPGQIALVVTLVLLVLAVATTVTLLCYFKAQKKKAATPN